MYPPTYEYLPESLSFDRLDMLWECYPQYHEMTTFSTIETLLEEHESWQEDFEELLEKYDENQYDWFLVQLSWSVLSCRYRTKGLIKEADPSMSNTYIDTFMAQF